jgi:anti-sigma regulatory factor (Ser/Thr protein kinase)
MIEKKEDFSLLTTEVETFCTRWSASHAQQYFVSLTVEEICQAIILHGFSDLENGYIELTLIAYRIVPLNFISEIMR